MSDPLATLLAAEADRRVAGQGVPPLDAVRVRRVVPRRRSRLRTAAPLVAAVASVVAVVLVAGQLQAPAPPELALDPPPALVLDPPPQLGVVTVAASAATRLGAPSGHVNGPAVTKGDLLAVSPTEESGQGLRLVGAVRDSPRAGLVDRCTAVTTEPAGELLDSSCDWSRPPQLPGPDGVSADLRGIGDQIWLSGAAPAGTAAVLLKPDGSELEQVPTAASGGRWGESVRWVAWWPEQGTDVIAVDADGAELARTRLPSPTIRKAQSGDPELGTMETPEQFRGLYEFMPADPAGRRQRIQAPDRVDVLAREQVEPGVTVLLVGFQSNDQWCTTQYVVDETADKRAQTGGGGGCGSFGPDGRRMPVAGGPAFGFGRSFVAGSGRPAEQLLSSILPPGTERLRLSAAGVATKTVRAYDAGPRWGNEAYVVTAWPSKPATRGEALRADGSVLASTDDDGLDARDQDPQVIEAQARCLERAGIDIQRLEGGAYSWNVNGREQLERSCLATAKREVPSTSPQK